MSMLCAWVHTDVFPGESDWHSSKSGMGRSPLGVRACCGSRQWHILEAALVYFGSTSGYFVFGRAPVVRPISTCLFG